MFQVKKEKILLALIVFIAFIVRTYGLNFDQGAHLHPDERFLTMVVSAIKTPPNIQNYFNQNESTLNPYNRNFNFYVYGTFPLLITRFFGELTDQTSYDQIYMIGRILSVLFDTLTVLLVFYLSLLIFKQQKIALWSAFLYTIAVFPIQQAHYFTVDSFTVFFGTLTLLLFSKYITSPKIIYAVLGGLSFGLTLANKSSLVLETPLWTVILFFTSFQALKKKILSELLKRFLILIIFAISCYIFFRLFQPYAFNGLFSLSPHFVSNIKEASQQITGEIDYPPNIQWAYTTALIHPLINIFLWGLGPILSLLSLGGIIIVLMNKKLRKNPLLLSLISYILIIFIYQGIQLAKYMRYFYPVYPVLMVFAGLCLSKLLNLARNNRFYLLLATFYLLLTLVWSIAFLSIYSRQHSRIAASEWIYQNIPPASKLTSENWDDGLPLPLAYHQNTYVNISLALYDPESYDKWFKIVNQLKAVDYLILSSNRLYGSIPKMPQRYPTTSLYYKLLFAGKLGFIKVAEFSSYPNPCYMLYAICYIDDSSAEESFTVYDHPKVIIFKKSQDDITSQLQPLLNQSLIKSAYYINPADTASLHLPRFKL